MATTPVLYGPHPNSDEKTFDAGSAFPFIGNFHKTLNHDAFGEVVPSDYEQFVDAAAHGDFESVPQSPGAAKLVDPQCGRATDSEGPDPMRMEMQPAPGVLSDSTAAEMTELLWMAALRDRSFETWDATTLAAPIADLKTAFGKALVESDPGRLQLGADLPYDGAGLNVNAKTLFRMGLKRERRGPLVSQFLLQDFNYGAHEIRQTVYPYVADRNYLHDVASWLVAQKTGRDTFGKDYPSCNNFSADKAAYDQPSVRTHIRNMRDLARFVNRDALHQAYFNAALQLLNWGESAVPFGAGNPYKSYGRQAPFGTLGGPHLLALVSEVAPRALQVVWRQKWLVHRRMRPEAYGGLLEMQKTQGRAYGLPAWVSASPAYGAIHALPGAPDTLLLPIAFSAGSPAHPSYGAGHASVAGACVTILKAWFQDGSFAKAIAAAQTGAKDPGTLPRILQPGAETAGELSDYTGTDKSEMTVHGELNKLASNVAMGRSMGGVHWRSDNTRSLRLGERVATIVLARQLRHLAERPVQLTYLNFDREEVVIEGNGKVRVKDNPELTTFYSRF